MLTLRCKRYLTRAQRFALTSKWINIYLQHTFRRLFTGDASTTIEHVDTTLWKWWCIWDLKACIVCAATSAFTCVLEHTVVCVTAKHATWEESQTKMSVCFQSKVDHAKLTLCQCYLWAMVWSRRWWSLHWGLAVTETLPSYTNPQSEGSLGWVPRLLPLVWRQCEGVFWCRLAAVVVVELQ